MPFGAKTAEADPAKALAVRQAIADLVDRQAIADQVYKGTYTPLYSYVPDGLTGATSRSRRSTATATAARTPTRPSRRSAAPA